MSRRVVFAFAVCAVVALGAGCTRIVAKPGSTSLEDFPVSCARDQVFDRALSFAQERNLEVKVLEKSSGLIRFERSALDASDLDSYCVFPLVNSRTGAPIAGTFVSWGDEYEGRSVGAVNLNLLLSDSGSSGTKASLRGNWSVVMVGHRFEYSGPINSNGTLEDELRRYLEESQGCAVASSPTNADKVEQLRRLRDKGLITPAEYQRKAKALSVD